MFTSFNGVVMISFYTLIIFLGLKILLQHTLTQKVIKFIKCDVRKYHDLNASLRRRIVYREKVKGHFSTKLCENIVSGVMNLPLANRAVYPIHLHIKTDSELEGGPAEKYCDVYYIKGALPRWTIYEASFIYNFLQKTTRVSNKTIIIDMSLR